jgi:hypothetical protein
MGDRKRRDGGLDVDWLWTGSGCDDLHNRSGELKALAQEAVWDMLDMQLSLGSEAHRMATCKEDASPENDRMEKTLIRHSRYRPPSWCSLIGDCSCVALSHVVQPQACCLTLGTVRDSLGCHCRTQFSVPMR